MKLFYAFLLAFFCLLLVVYIYPSFSSWSEKRVAGYYLEESMPQAGSPNVVSAITWDLRGFDTLGEETVLMTATLGALTVLAFREVKNGRNRKNRK
jgi:multisubunit Na+/H+ antiporter MnhB subunit